MGRLYRLRQYQVERLLFRVFLGNIPWEIEPANDIIRPRTAWDLIIAPDSPEPDPGYRETELGEIRSTIRKLQQNEIIDRMMAKARYEIHQLEDRRVLAAISEFLLAASPV